jgi:hypothetical protein
MSKVRAKFTVDNIARHLRGHHDEDGEYIVDEAQTITLTPVYSEDPDSENRLFWEATPAGKIELNTVNREAWEQFELGQEFYIDFIPANGDG